MSDKIIFKKIRKRNRSKEFLLPFNIINLSNNSSLKDLTLKPINKIKEKHINYNRKKKTISKGTNAIYSIVNNGKNKNKINSFNDRKIFFPCFDETKYVGDWNPSTIHSNGKFQNSINSNEEKISNKVNDKFIIRQKIKRFILNNNGDNIKLYEKMKKNKEILINNDENNKNNIKNNLKALHISSHYLGNIIDDKFGIVTNKFSIDKNLILTHSKPNKKYLNSNYNPYSLVLNIKNDPKLKFITLNMPDRSNFFNLVSSSNLFTKMKDSINNQKLYQQLMSQMSQVFKKRIKKYCIVKSYEKNHRSLFNDDLSTKNISNIKHQILFNDRFSEQKYTNKKDAKINTVGRNTLYMNENKDNYKTYDINSKCVEINETDLQK